MRQVFILLVLGLAVACAHPGSGGSESPEAPPATVLHAAEALQRAADARSQSGAFSGVVLLAYQGQPVVKKAYGLADRESGTPVTLTTRFVTASVTQTFTAVAVMQLIAKGDLSAETPVGTVLPEIPSAELKAVNVGQLLTHTSGVQGGVRSAPFRKDPARFASFHDYVQLAIAEPTKASGSFLYSDGGYALLGAVVQRVSGEPFGTYLENHVFRPAQMDQTVFRLRPRPAQLARGYTGRSIEGLTRAAGSSLAANDPILPTMASPGVGAASTVEDLLRFAEALRTHRLLDAGSTAELLRGRVSTGLDPPNERFGNGFFDGRVGRLHVVQHGGTGPGIDVCFDLYPELETTLIILSNLDPPAAQQLREVVRIELGGQPAS